MKYSIIGHLINADETTVLDKINTYNPIWRLNPNTYIDEYGANNLSFEIWLGDIASRDGCYSDMKAFVDTYTGEVSWHECTHDEANPKPCSIVESYRR